MQYQTFADFHGLSSELIEEEFQTFCKMCRTGNVPSQHKPKDEKYCEFSEDRMLTEIGFYEKFESDKANVWMLNKAQFNHVAKY